MPDRASVGLTAHVRREWEGAERLPDLIEAGEAVERMMSLPGWAAVQVVLKREIASIERELDDGAPKEAAEYAKEHGRLGALKSLNGAAQAVVEHAATRRRKAEEQQDNAAAESAAERMGE